MKIAGTNGFGHGTLDGYLKSLGAEVLICGGAQMALAEAGIKLFEMFPVMMIKHKRLR